MFYILIIQRSTIIWGDGSTPSNLKSSKGFEALLFILVNSPLKVLISCSILEPFCFNCSSYGIPANGQVASAEPSQNSLELTPMPKLTCVLDIPGGCIGDSCSPTSLTKSIVRVVRLLALPVLTSGDKLSKVDIGDNDPNELLSKESDNLPIMAEH
uniref:Uncharacterized protein n=1 Tax=Glossina austeni TaxID=7395 RepID=A0A1A9UGA4_GLOAU